MDSWKLSSSGQEDQSPRLRGAYILDGQPEDSHLRTGVHLSLKGRESVPPATPGSGGGPLQKQHLDESVGEGRGQELQGRNRKGPRLCRWLGKAADFITPKRTRH